MKTVILIPTYNERENVARLIPRIFAVAPKSAVMIIDDGSPDGTAAEVRRLQSFYPGLALYEREKKEGLGRAYMDAFKHVLPDPDVGVVCTMDADLSHNPEHLPAMFKAAEEYDFIVGSRYTRGGNIIGWEIWRKLLSALGNRYCRTVTRMPLKDCTSGFQCVRADLLRRMNFTDFDASGYAFLMYLKYKAWKHGARLCEIPICFKNRESGESKISVRIIREGILLPWKLIKKKKKMESPSCPVCKKNNARFWFTKNTCDIYRCGECGLIFVFPIPEKASALYTEDYFCGASRGFGYVQYEKEKESSADAFHEYLNRIGQWRAPAGTLFDVGAATGSFLEVARDRGWNVSGVEISSYAAEQGRKKGLRIQTGRVEDAVFPGETFDVTTLLDVFEHLPNPEETLRHLYRLLKPQGLLAMNMPNAKSLFARLMGKRWHLILPPEHLRLFGPENLKNMLERNGFSVLSKSTVGKKFKPAYMFHILSTIHNKDIWKRVGASVQSTLFNRVSIPINVRDNMFVIARKN